MKKIQNVFQTGERKAIPSVLVYLRYQDRILMLYRSDLGAGGVWNGLGGKCEEDESPLEAAVREVDEESGLLIEAGRFTPLGVIQFPLFHPKQQEDWWVCVFSVVVDEKIFRSPIRYQHSEHHGELRWISSSEFDGLSLWPGDEVFLPYVLKQEPFLGSIWYVNGKVSRTWISPMGRFLGTEGSCNFLEPSEDPNRI